MPLLMLAAVLAGGCDHSDEQASPAVSIAGGTWRVELATTHDQQYRGLSGRMGLAEDAGMLFIFPRPEILDFCMRGCHIPLDIAFLDSERRVVAMHTMTVEPDMVGRVTYSSDVPAQFALEVSAGALGRAGAKVGDRAVFSPQVPPAAKADAD
jgi:hypothetical protein